MEKEDFFNLLKAVPKAELHLHGEAVPSRETIKDLYFHSKGQKMSEAELDALFEYDDLAGFLESFIAIQNYFSRVEDIYLIMQDVGLYMEENNIVYAEVFFSPTAHIKRGFAFSDLSDNIAHGIEYVKKTYNRDIKVIVDVSRSFGLDNAMQNLNFVLNDKSNYIIGIGLGGDEKKGPAKDFAPVFEKAHANGLHTVVHAGEICDYHSIKDSIDFLYAERIGHGISSAYDADFLRELSEKQVPLEVCLESNVYTKTYVKEIESHPIRTIYDAKVPVTINTDDPVFFKTTLINEFWTLYSKLHFTISEVKEILLNSFKYSFLSEKEKESYTKDFEIAWDNWFKNHPDIKE